MHEEILFNVFEIKIFKYDEETMFNAGKIV